MLYARYVPQYCEENIYRFLERNVRKEEIDNYTVVFVTNKNRTVPFWMQRLSSYPDGVMIWDYHVFVLYENCNGDYLAYDPDSAILGPLIDSNIFIKETFHPHQKLREQFNRLFRCIPARDYLKHFSSDRSHMMDENGQWMAPPPLDPPIGGGQISTFHSYLDVTVDFLQPKWLGTLLPESLFYKKYASKLK